MVSLRTSVSVPSFDHERCHTTGSYLRGKLTQKMADWEAKKEAEGKSLWSQEDDTAP